MTNKELADETRLVAKRVRLDPTRAHWADLLDRLAAKMDTLKTREQIAYIIRQKKAGFQIPEEMALEMADAILAPHPRS